MASSSKPSISAAMSTLADSFSRLESAVANANRAQATQAADASASWENQHAQLDAAYAEAASENAFLKEDNLRLSNQLQDLQREYLALQEAAGSALTRLDISVKQLDVLLEH